MQDAGEIAPQYTTGIVSELCYTECMKAILYPDLMILIDLIVDISSLYITGKLTRKRIVWWRLVLAGLIGSLVSLGIVIIGLHGISVNYMVSVLALEIIMLLIAYQIRSVRTLLLLSGCQMLLIFGLHGILTILVHHFHIGYLTIVLMGILILWLLYRGYSRYRLEEREEKLDVRGILYWDSESVIGKGFVDTGNTLLDPVSHQPVVIVEGYFLSPILPEPYQKLVEQYMEKGSIDYDSILSGKLHKIRLIPYRTIREEEGSLLGIQCRRMVLIYHGRTSEISPVIVGISRTVINKGQEYQMLLPNHIL